MACTMKCVLLCLGFLILVTSVTADVNGTIDDEILAERYWRRVAYLHDDVILPCLIVEQFGYDPTEVVWWTPQWEPIPGKSGNKTILLQQNASLQITYVQEDDFGWYHCGILDEDISDAYGMYENISKALLAAVKTDEELTEQYKDMTTVGGIAAAICFGLFICISIGNQWCCSKTEDEEDDTGIENHHQGDTEENPEEDGGEPVRTQTYDNRGFVIDETVDGDTVTTSF